MNKLTQEELNGLSPRARKAYEESNSVLSEITIENPNAEKEDKPKKNVRIIIKQVSAMPGQGVTSMFNFGQSF